MKRTGLVIVGAVRTPIGAIGGGLSSLQALELSRQVIAALLGSTGLDPKAVDYTALGWVAQDARSPNIAKTAAELAGVPPTVPGTTFHENCASSGAAIHSVARRILLGEIGLGIAGGVESMSNIPRYLYSGRLKGQLYGDYQLVDGLFSALTDSHVGDGELMGLLTERLVEKYGCSREAQDEVAYASHHNALATWERGLYDGYVTPVAVAQRKGEPKQVVRDEGPRPITAEELAAAQNALVLTLPGRWETAGAVSGSLGEVVRFGFDDRYYDGYAAKVRAVTTAGAAEASRIVQPDKLVWVVAGDRAKIEPGLRELGLGEVKVIDADGNVLP